MIRRKANVPHSQVRHRIAYYVFSGGATVLGRSLKEVRKEGLNAYMIARPQFGCKLACSSARNVVWRLFQLRRKNWLY